MQFHLTLYNRSNHLFMLGMKSIYLSNMVPWHWINREVTWALIQYKDDTLPIPVQEIPLWR